MHVRGKGVQHVLFWIQALSNGKELKCIISHLLLFVTGFVACFTLLQVRTGGSVEVPQASARSKNGKGREYGNGWHSVEVFYGKTDLFERQIPDQEWFAQCNQDRIVSRVFRNKTNGYYLDLAANDAAYISNTYALEKHFKWTGLCIEPNPQYWNALAHRDCQVVAAVIGGKELEEVSFQFPFDGALGGIVRADFDNKDPTGSVAKYTTTLSEILNRFDAPKSIDYFSFDVEGAEESIMQHFPFDQYSVKFMSIERPNDGLRAILIKNGYEDAGDIGNFGETLWAYSSTKHLLDLDSIEALRQCP